MEMLILLTGGYLAAIPWSVNRYRRLQREGEAAPPVEDETGAEP